ncbi:MAG: hypothetical protein A3D96_07205 [Chlamydiae bacterium RIFCSPHIGHO2_12_FULL_44_59]|nr:MAG: hypothetical protein A2796_06215 [Chlamydiae bacterium RIFCSPHIGHO2_01_FULL_44_39]OGN58412.1 MAG: hypothetical protein A3C42_00515 [Chlamydiae bacterium RIFCSPHIGHO2_02_FULL_45_9]OGN59469.1 MAG: hypothetical protein A3D96_07205 [Chlamydiae bacterium RIFCSPHIGHO2_12_FULL_44_59]OGN67222.1 MAG: hypothetical protein A2978_03590 [Chlamydiae bacterium RIFCSPLOWO2_01_FULL_44_52]OGN67419.1 MAG: hypothetical protein A3I67_01160 [Chlamydiae bacterium RIFCSPLOWO2_02_FULL_45_22]OGN69151.1 MAG: hyp
MFHYPVIRTEKTASIEPVLQRWQEFTHIIFTSRTAVEYWPGPWDKELIAIGSQTAKVLPQQALIAREATQEGVAQLLQRIDGTFLYLRSARARPFLVEFMKGRGIPYFAFDLYKTKFQKPEPVPNLEDFSEVVFTSPSTVEGFLRIYGELPKGKKLIAIGPVTEAQIQLFMRNESKNMEQH